MTFQDPVDAKARDQFGRPIALNVNNVSDLSSHYDYSPERYRVFVDSGSGKTRQFIEYDGEPTEFEDTADSFKFKPQADGDVVTLETTEKFRYAVQYVIEWSAALQTNQALQSGDFVTLGYGDADVESASGADFGGSADGYFMYWDSGMGIGEVGLTQFRDGTQQSDTVVTGEQAITDWTRRGCEMNWYGVGASEFHETFTNSGIQENPTLGRISADDIKGPTNGNKFIQVSVKVGSSGAASLEAEVGSIGLRTFGDIRPIFRRKTDQWQGSIDATGEWVALDAIRTDPNRDLVNVQLTDVQAMEYSGSDDVLLLALSFSPSKLKKSDGSDLSGSDWSTPATHSSKGSVIERTSAVDQFPDSSGTIQTDGQAADPGGFQEGFGSLYTSGESANAARVQGGQQAKRAIYQRDVVVFLGKSSSTGTVTVEYTTEQQW